MSNFILDARLIFKTVITVFLRNADELRVRFNLFFISAQFPIVLCSKYIITFFGFALRNAIEFRVRFYIFLIYARRAIQWYNF